MQTLNHATNMFRFLMKPWRGKHEIYHIKFTKAITQSNVTRFVQQLRTLRVEKPSVIMLSINSAIGSCIQAEIAFNALRQVSEQHQAPIYSFVEDYALGAAYYLLCAGKTIHANPFSLVGDFSLSHKSFGFTDKLKQYNIKTEQFGQSILLNAFEKVTEEKQKFVEDNLNLKLQFLIQQVKESRRHTLHGISDSDLKQNVFLPKVFNSEQALQNGLIDQIQTFEEFKQQFYPKSSVKEIYVDKDTLSSRNLSSETILHFTLNKFLQQIISGKFDQVKIEQEIVGFLLEFVSGYEDNIEILSDFIADYLNSIIVNQTASYELGEQQPILF